MRLGKHPVTKYGLKKTFMQLWINGQNTSKGVNDKFPTILSKLKEMLDDASKTVTTEANFGISQLFGLTRNY
jgi:hypothetical protein